MTCDRSAAAGVWMRRKRRRRNRRWRNSAAADAWIRRHRRRRNRRAALVVIGWLVLFALYGALLIVVSAGWGAP